MNNNSEQTCKGAEQLWKYQVPGISPGPFLPETLYWFQVNKKRSARICPDAFFGIGLKRKKK